MRKISKRVRDILIQEPDVCALRQFGGCAGRITWEHSFQYGGKQVDEAWGIIKICSRHHSVDQYQDNGLLNKEKNLWVALNKATDEELHPYCKVIDYIQKRADLNKKYGVWKTPV